MRQVRMWAIAKAFEQGMGVEEVHSLTNIDRWFLSKLHGLHMIKGTMRSMDFYELRKNPLLLKEAKMRGFSDRQIAAMISVPEKIDSAWSPALLPLDHTSQRYTGGPVTEDLKDVFLLGRSGPLLISKDVCPKASQNTSGFAIVLGPY